MKELYDVFQALGNPVRWKVLKRLVATKKKDPNGAGVCVCKLVELTGVAGSTMTHHLDWLKSTGLVVSEKQGQWIYYDVDEEALEKFKAKFAKEL